jgi:acyl carrier protein phosphodiesterase
MNFLAHAYLSGTNEKVLVGNFIGDFIKGRQALALLEPEIARGVMIHRVIDEFTDSHPVVLESKKRLRPTYRHYAAVIVDVFYDHFLASQWQAYHPKSLQEFTEYVYATVRKFDSVLPNGVKYMLPYMVSDNWLLNYREIDGIGRALAGMARRTPYNSKMEFATSDLRTHYDQYLAEFKIFFPSLIDCVRNAKI